MSLLLSGILILLLLGVVFGCLFFLQYLFSNNIALMLQQAQIAQGTGNHRRAVALTSQIIDQIAILKEKKKTLGNSALIKALDIRAHAFIALEGYDSALSDAEMWVRLAPNDSGAYFCRGWVLTFLDEVDLAREDFLHTLDLPLRWYMSKDGIYHNLGLVEYIAGDYKASLKYYEQAITASGGGGQAVTHANMGIIYFRQNKIDKAWDAYRAAEKINSSHEHVRVGLAVLYAAENKWEKAFEIWRSLLKRSASFANADEVGRRYYRWTPSMADWVEQIVSRMEKPRRFLADEEFMATFGEPEKQKRDEDL